MEKRLLLEIFGQLFHKIGFNTKQIQRFLALLTVVYCGGAYLPTLQNCSTFLATFVFAKKDKWRVATIRVGPNPIRIFYSRARDGKIKVWTGASTRWSIDARSLHKNSHSVLFSVFSSSSFHGVKTFQLLPSMSTYFFDLLLGWLPEMTLQ